MFHTNKLLIVKLKVAIFAPIPLEKEKQYHLYFNQRPIAPDPLALLSDLSRIDRIMGGKLCTNTNFPLTLQAIFASRRCTFALLPNLCRDCK